MHGFLQDVLQKSLKCLSYHRKKKAKPFNSMITRVSFILLVQTKLFNNWKIFLPGYRGVEKTTITHQFTSSELRAEIKATLPAFNFSDATSFKHIDEWRRRANDCGGIEHISGAALSSFYCTESLSSNCASTKVSTASRN
jgi:hypothetical protein